MGFSVPILVLVVGISDIIFSKLIVGEKRSKISETEGKLIQRVGLSILVIIGLGSLFLLDTFDPNVMKWFWLGFLIVAIGFQGFLEWRYLKGSKEYIVSLFVLVIGIVYILIFMF